MDIEVIQESMDDLSLAMLAKGLRNPSAQFHIEAHVAPLVYMRWGIHGQGDEGYDIIHDPNPDQAINDAFALIEAMPSAEEAKRQQFMASLAKVIDLGRENGIEVDFLNPLTETMKRLSENAITYQPKVFPTEAELDEIFGPATPPERPDPDFDDGNITP